MTVASAGVGSDVPTPLSMSEVEKRLRQVWATVLNMDAASFGLDDNFFELGGDSIDAMRVVSKARKVGLPKLKVVDLYSHPILRDAVSRICPNAGPGNEDGPKNATRDTEQSRRKESTENGHAAIRGLSVDLEAVKDALARQPHVREALAAVQQVDDQEPRIIAFVTLHDDDTLPLNEELRQQQESKQVELWRGIYDDEAYTSIGEVQTETVGRDFIGWNSMFDGKPIDKVEMEEWLQDTIGTILNGRPASHVLEIGSGSGMILFNLGSGLQSYVGIEPSEKAVQFITKSAKLAPMLSGKVKMYNASAGDIHLIREDLSPETVIINSVAQYFPSQDYLFKVIKDLVQLKGVQTLFFGDIRSYAQYRDFLAARALHMLGGEATPDQVRAVMTQLESSETEFLVDPAFFTGLQDRLPDYVGHVEILPKAMHATNELSCYRFSAVVHIRQNGQPMQVHTIDQSQWHDYESEALTRHSLRQMLQTPSTPSVLAVGNIPHSKTAFERHIVDGLDNQGQQLDPATWQSSIRDKAQSRSALSVVDLKALAQEAGYGVETSWARQFSQRGGLDAIFHKIGTTEGSGRVLFQFPTEHQGRAQNTLSTQPMRQQFRRSVQEQLREKMKSELPSHMTPDKIVVVDKMPAVAQAGSGHLSSKQSENGGASNPKTME
ncbi:hypothetical protein QQS21_005515 [Conoideocrella luteorostrata]|uniref:Carrier domain-containing protein n=1 Tax=Conoideocrella luteorostrata TaxID=1105319 RepID=A0AAJ0CPC3_9HYPO|nr:hypothetical protein QQS21_005515 [Conoideocrella luteorostrata]